MTAALGSCRCHVGDSGHDPTALRTAVAETLADAERSGRPPTFSAEHVVQIINLACQSPHRRAVPGFLTELTYQEKVALQSPEDEP